MIAAPSTHPKHRCANPKRNRRKPSSWTPRARARVDDHKQRIEGGILRCLPVVWSPGIFFSIHSKLLALGSSIYSTSIYSGFWLTKLLASAEMTAVTSANASSYRLFSVPF
jgi:hypothetical protein